MGNKSDVVTLLKRLNISLQMCGSRSVGEGDVTLSQLLLLDLLLEMEPGQALFSKDLGQKTGISRSTVSSMLKRMKQNGYLEMVADEEDNRRKQIVLTAKAYQARQEAAAVMQNLNQCLCRGLSEQELDCVRSALQTMLQNLQSECERRVSA